MKHYKSQQGYSLIELIVYLALFAMLSVVMINSLVSAMKTYATAESYRVLQNNGELVMSRLTREIRDASSISSSSVYGSNPGQLILSRQDATNTTHTMIFSVNSGAIEVSDNGDVGPLTTSEVVVNSLIFRDITSANVDGVKVELTLSTAKGHSNTATFYTTVLMRK